MPDPQPRSPTWLTSTFPADSASPDAQLCSAGYQACCGLPSSTLVLLRTYLNTL